MAYPFPDDIRDPDRTQPNPFADEHLDEDADSPEDDREFRASARGGEYQPEYVATQSNRAFLILGLGIVGGLGSFSGWTAYTGSTELILMPFISLAFSMPAIGLGWSDAAAIKAGAKKNDNVGWLLLGITLGLLAVANTAAYVIVGIVVTDLLRF